MAVHKINVAVEPIEFELNPKHAKYLPADLAAKLTDPIPFGIPPLDWIPRPTMDKYKAWAQKNNRTATKDDANLKLLELVLDPEVYELVAALPPAVAADITDRLAEDSEASLGESGASTTS